jgi:hypothetical protein
MIVSRYYFHVQSNVRQTDENGLELTDDIEARRQAIRAAGDMLKEYPEEFWGSRPWSVTVTNAAGLVLWELYLDGVAAAIMPQV